MEKKEYKVKEEDLVKMIKFTREFPDDLKNKEIKKDK